MWTRDLFQDVFERQMTERVHAFVGLMGIPIMRRDYRVRLGDQVLVKSYKTRRVENTNFYINDLLFSVAFWTAHHCWNLSMVWSREVVKQPGEKLSPQKDTCIVFGTVSIFSPEW